MSPDLSEVVFSVRNIIVRTIQLVKILHILDDSLETVMILNLKDWIVEFLQICHVLVDLSKGVLSFSAVDWSSSDLPISSVLNHQEPTDRSSVKSSIV